MVSRLGKAQAKTVDIFLLSSTKGEQLKTRVVLQGNVELLIT